MKRPTCKSCEVVWSRYAEGELEYCPRCNSKIIDKNIDPGLNIGAGIIIITVSVVILLMNKTPIWVGGFILGISLILKGNDQQKHFKKIDDEAGPNYIKPRGNVFNCEDCDTEVHLHQGIGVKHTNCSGCGKKYML